MVNDFLTYFYAIESPVIQALYATLFTWGLTALGAAFVFFFKTMNRAVFDGMLGFTGGVMVAASFWSLLSPAIDMSAGEGFIKVMPSAIGFLGGALFLFGLDKVMPHLHINFKRDVFPAPLGPVRKCIEPGSSLNEISFRTRR